MSIATLIFKKKKKSGFVDSRFVKPSDEHVIEQQLLTECDISNSVGLNKDDSILTFHFFYQNSHLDRVPLSLIFRGKCTLTLHNKSSRQKTCKRNM